MGAMVATVRANVKAWECDVMEHMNVQHYLARSAETVGQLRVLLGLGDDPDLALVHRAERVLFMRELRNGETYTVTTGILAVNGTRLTTFNQMHNLETDDIAARFVLDLELVAIIEAQRFNAAHAVMLVHSFSQSSEWFQDYAAFVSLMGGSAKENSTVSVGSRSGVSLHLAWVRGNAQYLSR